MLIKVVFFAATLTVCFAASYGIEKPCYLNDYGCIRDNLAANSKCKTRVKGSLPQQYTVPKFKFETPYFNATYIDKNLIVRNHDKCFVSEFFVNQKKDTMLLSVDCPQLDLESDRQLIQHWSLKEDTTYNYHIRGVYPLIRLTINARRADTLDLCSAFVFGDVTALPIFRVDPKDLPTANFLSKDLSALNIYERETFLYRAGPLARIFINSFICDFGCNF